MLSRLLDRGTHVQEVLLHWALPAAMAAEAEASALSRVERYLGVVTAVGRALEEEAQGAYIFHCIFVASCALVFDRVQVVNRVLGDKPCCVAGDKCGPVSARIWCWTSWPRERPDYLRCLQGASRRSAAPLLARQAPVALECIPEGAHPL